MCLPTFPSRISGGVKYNRNSKILYGCSGHLPSVNMCSSSNEYTAEKGQEGSAQFPLEGTWNQMKNTVVLNVIVC